MHSVCVFNCGEYQKTLNSTGKGLLGTILGFFFYPSFITYLGYSCVVVFHVHLLLSLLLLLLNGENKKKVFRTCKTIQASAQRVLYMYQSMKSLVVKWGDLKMQFERV